MRPDPKTRCVSGSPCVPYNIFADGATVPGHAASTRAREARAVLDTVFQTVVKTHDVARVGSR